MRPFIFSLSLLAVPSHAQTNRETLPSPATAPATRPEQAALPLSATGQATLSLADRRALIYLYFRLDQTRLAQEIAEDILREFPADRETLKMLTNLYLDHGRHAAALRTARDLVRYFPHDPEARFILSRAYKAGGQTGAAREILRELKASNPPNQPFLYEEDLAILAAQSGDWPLAIQSYRDLLQREDLEPDVQQEVRQQLDQLYRTHLPQAHARISYVKPQAGRILRSTATISRHLDALHRVAVKLDRDDITVDRAEFLRQRDSDRFDAQVGLVREVLPWQAQLWAGGSSAGGIFSGSVTRTLGEESRLTFTLAANQRSVDSLLIESLDGREDKVAVRWSATWGDENFLDLEVRGRRVSLSDETLGYGMVASGTLGRSVAVFPELKYGYRTLISTFSSRSPSPELVEDVTDATAQDADRELLLENLVQPINLHGVFLSWEHQFHSRLTLRADLGSDYSFERSDVGYSAEAGLSFFPWPNLEMVLEGGYSTSAQTSNVESELVQFSFALRYFF